MSNSKRSDRYNPRRFDREVRELCWQKADKIDGLHPDRWRLDAVGNPVLKALNHCKGPICYNFDHIIPYTKDGQSTADNCQILQTFVNIFKSNKEGLTKEDLLKVSPQVKFTSEQLKLIEYAVYGE